MFPLFESLALAGTVKALGDSGAGSIFTGRSRR
jgi:hypothetical protein